MIKKILTTFAVLLLICTGSATAFYIQKIHPKSEAQVIETKIPNSSIIEYSKDKNFLQSINDCGPFSAAAVIRILKNPEISSAKIAKEMEWRMSNNYTIPIGLEELLNNYGIKTETPDVTNLSDQEKLRFLKQEISKNKPIILLGLQENYQHYLTLIGYDSSKNEFYAYNSFLEKNPENPTLTIDENGDIPGNQILTETELLEFWSKSGMYGLYKWYTLIAST